MPVIRPDEAIVHDVHGARFTSFASPATGSSHLCAWRLDMPGGSAGTPHRVSHDEVLVITRGTLDVAIDDDTDVVEPGDVVVVPAGASFRVDNRGDQPASAWVTTSVGLEATMADGSRLRPPWAN